MTLDQEELTRILKESRKALEVVERLANPGGPRINDRPDQEAWDRFAAAALTGILANQDASGLKTDELIGIVSQLAGKMLKAQKEPHNAAD